LNNAKAYTCDTGDLADARPCSRPASRAIVCWLYDCKITQLFRIVQIFTPENDHLEPSPPILSATKVEMVSLTTKEKINLK
jgi:hypothetical protein